MNSDLKSSLLIRMHHCQQTLVGHTLALWTVDNVASIYRNKALKCLVAFCYGNKRRALSSFVFFHCEINSFPRNELEYQNTTVNNVVHTACTQRNIFAHILPYNDATTEMTAQIPHLTPETKKGPVFSNLVVSGTVKKLHLPPCPPQSPDV